MGMGYASCQVDTIDEDFIKEQCPTEFQEFVDSFEEEDNNSEFDTIDDFARFVGNEDLNNADYKLREPELKYIALCRAFETKTDLEIGLFYHDSEDGDRYDDFTGRAWQVNGVYQYTPAGEKYKDKIQAQMDAGSNFGVTGTPGNFINGEPAPGAVPFEDFTDSTGRQRKGMRSIIERHLWETENPVE